MGPPVADSRSVQAAACVLLASSMTAGCLLSSDVDEFGTGAATTGGGSGSPSSSASGNGGSGGSGGAWCGNGIIDRGEECDDKNDMAGDGCLDCVVECSGDDVVLKDRTTFHCYRVITAELAWPAGRGACQGYGPGYELAAFSSAAEYAALSNWFPALATFSKSVAWVGANDLEVEGTWVWSNGEPWWPALPLEVSDTEGTEDCSIVGASGIVNDSVCMQTTLSLCEGTPVSAP